VTGAPLTQAPALHASAVVHPLPSSQLAPSGFAVGGEQPETGMQTLSARWQASGGGHASGLLPVQTPDWQVSVWVQALASSQAVPVRSLQVPSLSAPAATEQASQGPRAQAVEQQTPSTQRPRVQSVGVVQGSPGSPKE
jgi:hypothetical protein